MTEHTRNLLRIAGILKDCGRYVSSSGRGHAELIAAAEAIEALTKDAARWQWMQEQIKTEAGRVAAQALLWNHSSREELDAAVDFRNTGKEAGA